MIGPAPVQEHTPLTLMGTKAMYVIVPDQVRTNSAHVLYLRSQKTITRIIQAESEYSH